MCGLARSCREEQVSDRAAKAKVEELAQKLIEHDGLDAEGKAQAKEALKGYRKSFAEQASESAPQPATATWRLRGRGCMTMCGDTIRKSYCAVTIVLRFFSVARLAKGSLYNVGVCSC